MLVFLYSCLLKPSTTLFTPKTATPPAHSPTPHHTKYGSTRNQTSLDFVHSAAKPMSMITHRSTASLILELLKASSLGMQIPRRPIRYISQRREQLFALHMFGLMLTPTWLAASRLRGRFNSNIVHSSLPSKNSTLNIHPAQNLHPLLMTLSSIPHHLILPYPNLFQNLFPMFRNLFQMLLHMIHLLVAHVNLNHHLLHVHHHLVRLNLQIEVIHHAYRRLDHQTLSHFQQTVLTLMLGQMLIQGEHLLMRNLTIRSLQILHMEKNQRLTLKLWHHLMPLSGLQQNAMSLTSLLYLMFMTSLYYHLVVRVLDADGSIRSSMTLKGILFSTELA